MVDPIDYDDAAVRKSQIDVGGTSEFELQFGGLGDVEIVQQIGSYTLSGLSSTDFDSDGFIDSRGAGWTPITFSNLRLEHDRMLFQGNDFVSSTGFEARLEQGGVGIYVESINASTQYDWSLSSELGTFKLYSPLQDFSATYPSLYTKDMTGPMYAELGIKYASAETEGLAAKFGTLPTSETALIRIQNRTKELAALIASTRNKKLTFSKSNNNYKLNSSDLYGILSSESTQGISLNISATTGSNVRETEDISRGRTTYSSYT